MATFASELRIAMFGKSNDDMTTLTNFISGKQDSKSDPSNPKATKTRTCVQGEWKRTPFTIFKTKEELPFNKIRHEIMKCVAHCPPGPNILLLLVDPYDFTKNDCEKLKFILSFFDKDAFQYSMVVITQSETSVNPFVQKLVQKCNQRHHKVILDVKRRPVHVVEELMEKLGDIVNQNRGQHLSLTETEPKLEAIQFLDSSKSPNEHQTHLMESQRQVHRQSSESQPRNEQSHNLHLTPSKNIKFFESKNNRRDTQTKSQEQKLTSVQQFNSQRPKEWQNNRSPIEPRPRNKPPMDPQFQRRLSLFEQTNTPQNDQNVHTMKSKSESDLRREHQNYVECFKSVFDQNSDPEGIAKPPLNIVLCGKYGDWKTLATYAILGQKQSGLSSDCVKRQVEVCGRTVSIVDLPTLSGKPPDIAKKEAFKTISVCDPEGVHAFVLVLPVGPITTEDKTELEAIQNSYGSDVNDKTLIVFTVDSETSASAVSNFVQYNTELKNFCQSCGGRYVIFNINDRQQVIHLLTIVENMNTNGSKAFTKELFPKPPVNKVTRSVSLKKLANIRAQRRQSQTESLRLVMVGKTGCGKSATANTILGRDEFASKTSQNSVTRDCRKVEEYVEGRALEIVDTPGLFDTTLSNAEVQEELVKCISLLAPGPHVFLLVMQIGRFTQEEQETVQLIKDFFGKSSQEFIMIVFTKGDELKNTTMESFLAEDVNGFVPKLISECRGRYQVFNNNDRENREQVRELLHKIEGMVNENESRYYTSEMFKEAENAIEKETAKILKQREPEIVRQQKEIEKKLQEELKMVQNKKSMIPKIQQEIQQSVEQLREIEETFKTEQKRRNREQERRELEETITKSEEELQRNKWKLKCDNLQKQIQSEQRKSALPEMMVMSIGMDEMRREWDSWEKERREWWERRYQEDEQRRLAERERHERLRREYDEERQKYEEERQKYEAKRQEEEQDRKEQEVKLQEKYHKELEKVKKENEYEARKQAVSCNEFQHKYAKDVMAEMEKYNKEMQLLRQRQQSSNEFLLKHLSREKTCRKEYNMLKKNHEMEIKALQRKHYGHDHEDHHLQKEMMELQRKHEEEVQLWIQNRVQRSVDNKSCSIL